MEISPLKFVREAIKAVPAVRYAVGVGGIASIIAIIAGFKVDYRVAVFGSIIVIGLMFILLTFSNLTKPRGKKSLRLPAMVLTWAFLILTIFSSVLLSTSFFFKWPLDFNKSLPKGVIIKGSVMDNGGKPIMGAEISIDNTDIGDKSDSDGKFIIEYRGTAKKIGLMVEHDDYKTARKSRVIENSEEQFKFNLERRKND